MLLSNVMLVLALLILGAGIAAQGRDSARRTPCTFFWGALFLVLFILFPLILNFFFGYGLSIRGDLLTNEAGYLVYGLTVLVFCLVYSFGVFIKLPQNLDPNPASIPQVGGRSNWKSAPTVEKYIFFLCGFMVPLGLMVYIHGTGLSLAELVVASRFEWFVRETVTGIYINLGMYFLGLVSLFTYYDIKFGFPRKWLSCLVYGAILVTIFLTGGRKWLLFMASGGVVGYYDAKGGVFLLTRKLGTGLIAVALLVFILQFGRAISWQDEAARQKASEAAAEVIPVLFVEGDATYFYRASLDAIRVNMEEGVVYPLAIVRRILFLPLPDNWTSGLKPEGIPFLFSDEMDAGNKIRRGNMPPGLVGLFVLSFGWSLTPLMMALLLIPLLGALDRFVNRYTGPLRNSFFTSYPVAAILLMRGSTGGIYFMVFNCVIVFLAVVAFRLTINYKNAVTGGHRDNLRGG